MIFIAKPDYEEYEMTDGAVIVADSEDEALCIAKKELNSDYFIAGHEVPQKWTVKIIDTRQKGVILQSVYW